ncbi:transposon Tf2-1 polyprotein, partial [Trifolium medium]|nr:transposon Tf2-1 polyprotein [Trifolium medium]
MCCFQLASTETSTLLIPADMPSDLAALLLQFAHIFNTPTSLPPKRTHDHSIPLMDESKVVKVRPYRYPHSQKEQIELMVADMLKQGIIQPSTSHFSSPIILVKKKDGTWRFCTDYRALNALTIKDSFPLPTVDELLDELFGAKVFSKLDLRAGYHQILMNPSDRHKTAFRTHHGHYEWKFVLVFFDDILVYSPSWVAHLEHLHIVLQLLSDHHLFVKLSKCSFGMNEVEYLGHVVSGNGVSMDKLKVQAVMDWPIPSNVKQLRGFLGLTGYYRRFIKSYATISAPLTDLLKKDQFQWSTTTAVSFDTLKKAVTSAPVLALPNFSQPFVLETDASNIGLGAVLSQQGHPIAYFSKKLGPNVQKQSAYLREFRAITEALAKFRHYLLGHKFIIRTDQQSLKALLDQSLQTPEQQA